MKIKGELKRILIAPDKFKGSLTALEVCEAIEVGLRKFRNDFQVTRVPLADGGEGTLSVLASNMALKSISVKVSDPLFRPVTAHYLMNDTTAFIEMASASGLELLAPAERNCLYTTTYGTGQLIKDAIKRGAGEIYLFVGGSATNDAGIGMASALGYSFVDGNSEEVKPIGQNLAKIEDFSLMGQGFDRQDVSFYVVCDVQNRLSGPEGAAWIYAAQKGADQEAIAVLDHGLTKFGKLMNEKLKRDIAGEKGSGAAGGLGAGAMAFLNASMKSGINTVMDIVGMEGYANDVDLIITGEGKFDRQTLEGKVIAGVSELAVKFHKPLAVLCGIKDNAVTDADLENLGVLKLLTLKKEKMDIDFAIENAYDLLVKRSTELIKALLP